MDHNQPHHIGTLSPEMALLGLLYAGPAHGYELHHRVITDLGQVWHLSQSQAYSILKRLEARGDISVEEVLQEKLPARQILHMTDEGRKRFLEWLDTPSGGSTRTIRMEFVTRLYFIDQYFPERVTQAFDQQRAEAEKHFQRLQKARTELPAAEIYNRMSLDLRLYQLKTVQEWLDESQKSFLPDKSF